MDNASLTRTNKYIGTNVVDIDYESGGFPIHLLHGSKVNSQKNVPMQTNSPPKLSANQSAKRTPSPQKYDNDCEIGESTLAAIINQNDEEDMEFEGINDAILEDENLKDILEGLDIDEEDIEDYVAEDDRQRGIGMDRRQQKMHLVPRWKVNGIFHAKSTGATSTFCDTGENHQCPTSNCEINRLIKSKLPYAAIIRSRQIIIRTILDFHN